MGSETLKKSKTPSLSKLSQNQQKKLDFNTKIAPFMKIGFLLASAISLHNMWTQNYINDSFNTEYLTSKFFWIMIFFLSISHIIYFIIWHFPSQYITICSNPCVHPVDLTFAFVFVGKVVQFSICIIWYLYINSFFLGEETNYPVSFLKLASGVFLLICGQWLNSAVWKTLGINGVCYGFKLGRPVPWITGFPFNIGVSNPQYVGSVITNFGFISILINPLTAKSGILFAFMMQSLFYAFSSYVETYTGTVSYTHLTLPTICSV